MDFFAAQDHARRTSRLLVLWFALAVVGLILSVYAVAIFALGVAPAEHAAAAGQAGELHLWQPDLLLFTALGVGGFVLIGSLFKISVLSRNGGERIAQELGGRRVARSTTDPLEQRLVNVVDEMAIASGIPAPPVYVLDQEAAINAFAAGARPSEGVVAVTRGALEQLNRDELQGVIAHEFSHILNGDMRLNLRLIGILHGILLLTLAGRMLMYSSRGSRNAAPAIFTGLALIIVGYVGVLFGKIIKAAVSRQREFLADASAVQFTRNPDGIAGALKRISGVGSTVQHPRAEEASHMFFGSSAKFSSLLATHPPIEERIRRLDPAFEPAAAPRPDAGTASATPTAAPFSAATTMAFSAQSYTDHVGQVTDDDLDSSRSWLAQLPPALINATHERHQALALVFALFFPPEPDLRSRQLVLIGEAFGDELRRATHDHAATVDALQAGDHLPVLDLCLPTLTEYDADARKTILATVDQLIEIDQQTTLFEYVARRLLRARLAERSQRPAKAGSAAELRRDAATLFAFLIQAGDASQAEASRAAFAAALKAMSGGGPWPDFDVLLPSLSAAELDRILDHLSAAPHRFRKDVVRASATAIEQGGRASVAQFALLRAICQALDCPAPPVAGSAP